MWKHKTKWLVRGGRKVRCYLCGKKILAKGDLFLFHGDTGYYSHQSCQAESTTISGNERRRAVKKIAVGAAVVGAIAAGAGKFLDVSPQSKNSSAAQTILTSQGLILPALTSDPANPVAGQMWYRSDKGVTAHFDSIENRVIYSNRIVDGSAVVTSKGIVNGLSVLPNDGQDWGPDTTKGATAPGQYGGTYTETVGIQEACNYGMPLNKKIVLNSGTYTFSTTIQTLSGNYTTSSYLPLYMEGAGEQNTILNYMGTGTGFILTGANQFSTLKDFSLYTPNNALIGMSIGTSGSNNALYQSLVKLINIGIGNGISTLTEPQTGLISYCDVFIMDHVSLNGSIYAYHHSSGNGGGQDTYMISGGAGVYYADNTNSFTQDFITSALIGHIIAGNNNGTNASEFFANNINMASQSQYAIEIGNSFFVITNSIISQYGSSYPIYLNGANGLVLKNISLETSGTGYPYAIYGSISQYGIFDIDGLTSTVSSIQSLFSLTSTPNRLSIKNSVFPYTIPITTPAVPASGTAQQNTNPFVVDIYIYGGTVTEIQITRGGTTYTVFSNSTGLALSGQGYKLNPGDSITVTYTAAPSWEWLSD